jgi:hypothetical protein
MNMAQRKETKAELTARLLQERSALLVELKETYQTRLMAQLRRAVNVHYFELAVNNDMSFLVQDKNNYKNAFTLPLAYSEEAEETLNELMWVLETADRDKQEAERQYLVRQSALAKLSKEERELLGV